MTNYVKLVAERDAAQEFERARSKTEVVMREEQRASLDGYLRSLRQIAVSRLRDEANREATLVRQEMEDRGQRQLKGFVPVVTRHLAALRGDTLPSLERVKSDILAVPVAPER